MRFWNKVNSDIKNIMPELTAEKLKAAFDEISELVARAAELKEKRWSAEGEDAKAIELVYNDFLWKIQRKVGELHFFVCGFEGFKDILSS